MSYHVCKVLLRSFSNNGKWVNVLVALGGTLLGNPLWLNVHCINKLVWYTEISGIEFDLHKAQTTNQSRNWLLCSVFPKNEIWIGDNAPILQKRPINNEQKSHLDSFFTICLINFVFYIPSMSSGVLESPINLDWTLVRASKLMVMFSICDPSYHPTPKTHIPKALFWE